MKYPHLFPAFCTVPLRLRTIIPRPRFVWTDLTTPPGPASAAGHFQVTKDTVWISGSSVTVVEYGRGVEELSSKATVRFVNFSADLAFFILRIVIFCLEDLFCLVCLTLFCQLAELKMTAQFLWSWKSALDKDADSFAFQMRCFGGSVKRENLTKNLFRF